ncbi:MAG TPA: carboxypeptidase-like regulatory domain-containing protein [Vicinamibacterales bacterium]|nr:carboxypeptidase-like regulatory domain-containing protein [Vicinamibacterales bacterium]
MLRLGLMLVVAAVSSTTAAAQETTGTITGTTTDQTGAVLPGVSVTLKNVDTGSVRTVVTNEAGLYTAALVPIGQYEVTFELQGFQSVTLRNVTLHVNDRLQLDGRLTLGAVAESVDVTAGRTLVQPIAALQSTMTSTQVKELPLNNRNFVQLATLAPGVSSDLADEVGVGLTSTVSISINGARRNAVNWLVDGVSDVDVGSNITLLSTPSLESIEEFKIITNGYQAEWPRSGGGIVNVVTKSGTGRYSGSAYEFLRSDKLNANSFFRNLNADPAINSTPAPLKYNNFGGTVGGPIVPTKMFFFFSEELRRIKRVTPLTASTFDPAWLSDPTNANYVAPALRDPNAVKLLGLYPAPNVTGRTQFLTSSPGIQNTRQEVARVDYDLSPAYRLTGRFSHDNSYTQEPGGLFLGFVVPDVSTTETNVPGQVAAGILRSMHGTNTLNEVQFQFSSNSISDANLAAGRNLRSSLGLTIPEVFPGNDLGIMPLLAVTGQLSSTGANQLFKIEYRNYTVTDSFTWQHGEHGLKFGGLMTFERKNENAANQTQGNFTFAAGGGHTAFYNFLSGNADGSCDNACTYTEAQRDVTVHLRFNRYEMFAQDSWKPHANLTVDYGVRYSLYPPVTDANGTLTNFLPSRFDPARAPTCANATCSTIVAGTGDPLNGIIVAGQNSPFGDAVYAFDKGNIQPRVGVTWDPASTGRTIYRGSYGVYYDQALVGIFEQNAFTNPPFVATTTILDTRLSNPGAGTTSTTIGVPALIGNGDDFKTPRTQQWNVGVQQQLYARGALDVSYVGAHGDHLIRPIDINYPQPADVLRLGSVNLARPYLGYGAITLRTTTARSNYWGVLTSLRHDGGAAGSLTLNYTLSRNRTDASNDRDAIDLPQNPLDLEAEYADARTDRRHIFTANYVYNIPFMKDSPNALVKGILAGWQIAGITTLNSGQPIPRISENTNGFLRGGRPNLVADPAAGQQTANLFWFDPNAYAPAADGTFGNSGRAEFRQPGRNQTDLSISKNWTFNRTQRIQFRADAINAFNHTQWLADPQASGLDNTCTVSLTTCNTPADTFGQILATRAPREIQVGLKFYW